MFRRLPKIAEDVPSSSKNFRRCPTTFEEWLPNMNITKQRNPKRNSKTPVIFPVNAWEMVLYAWNLCSQSACVRLGRYKNPLESAQEREAYRLCVYDSWRGKAGWSTVQRGTKTIDDRLGFYQLTGPQQHWKFNYYMSTSSTSLLRNLLKSQCFRIAS